MCYYFDCNSYFSAFKKENVVPYIFSKSVIREMFHGHHISIFLGGTPICTFALQKTLLGTNREIQDVSYSLTNGGNDRGTETSTDKSKVVVNVISTHTYI